MKIYINITQEGVKKELPKEYKEKNYLRGVIFSYIFMLFVAKCCELPSFGWNMIGPKSASVKVLTNIMSGSIAPSILKKVGAACGSLTDHFKH